MLCSNMPKSVVPWGLIFDSMNIIPRSFINFPRRSLWARLRICLLCDSDGHTWHVFHKSCAKEWWPGQRIHGRIWQDGEDGKPMAWSKKKEHKQPSKNLKNVIVGEIYRRIMCSSGSSCSHFRHANGQIILGPRVPPESYSINWGCSEALLAPCAAGICTSRSWARASIWLTQRIPPIW